MAQQLTNIRVQIWAKDVRRGNEWRVAEGIDGYGSKRSISQFLVKYLILQSQKSLLTLSNYSEKLEELALIKETDEENALEATFAGIKYFIRYANFEF